MKLEPLINKTQSHCHRKDMTDRHDIHDDKDIKSAIECLKGMLIGVDYKYYKKPNEFIFKKIDEAFEDVQKNKL